MAHHAEGFIDGFVDSPNENEKDLKIAVTLTIDGSDITWTYRYGAQVDLRSTCPSRARGHRRLSDDTLDLA